VQRFEHRVFLQHAEENAQLASAAFTERVKPASGWKVHRANVSIERSVVEGHGSHVRNASHPFPIPRRAPGAVGL
jgi:hypothetical protein